MNQTYANLIKSNFPQYANVSFSIRLGKSGNSATSSRGVISYITDSIGKEFLVISSDKTTMAIDFIDIKDISRNMITLKIESIILNDNTQIELNLWEQEN